MWWAMLFRLRSILDLEFRQSYSFPQVSLQVVPPLSSKLFPLPPSCTTWLCTGLKRGAQRQALWVRLDVSSPIHHPQTYFHPCCAYFSTLTFLFVQLLLSFGYFFFEIFLHMLLSNVDKVPYLRNVQILPTGQCSKPVFASTIPQPSLSTGYSSMDQLAIKLKSSLVDKVFR